MSRNKQTARRWTRHAVVAAIAALLPLAIVQLIPSDSISAYAFKATLTNQLGQSSNQQLLYYEARVDQGTAPADTIVVALDRSYTRGLDAVSPETESTYWFQGSLMTPDVFYGEQYLFFGMEEVYVSQVKAGLFWPNQVTELGILYLSPVATVLAPVQIPFLLWSDSLSARLIGTLLARCALLAVTAVFVIRRRRDAATVLFALLLCAVVAILLTMPILPDLY